MGELLAGRDRQVHLLAHVTERVRVEGAYRILVEVEPVRLEGVAEVRGLGGAEHRVGVEQQVDPVADRRPQRLRRRDRLDDAALRVPLRQPALVEGREGAVAQRRKALLPQAERVLDQRLGGVAGEVPVDAHLLARRPAEQVVHRDAEPLPLEVPERDVDPGDRAHHDLPVRPERPARQLAPDVLDPARVAPDEQVGEVVEDPDHASPPSGEARLADPGQPLVRANEDDDHRVVVPVADAHG